MPSPLEIQEKPSGLEFRLRVSPGARRPGLLGLHGGALKLAVAAPPEKGKANRAVLGLLAALLEVPEKSLELVSGETSQDKRVRIAKGMLDAAALQARIAALLADR